MIFFTEVFGKKLNFKCSQKYQNNELGLKQWQNNYSSINQTKIQTQQIFELMIGDGIQSVFRNPLWEIKQKLQRYPTKRWGHTATINKNKLYIYGGKTGKTKEPIYELDLDTLQSQIFDINGFPEARESHSCALIKDKLIIWGGCRQEKALNDCLAITFKDQLCIWSPITQFTILKERESHATTVLRDKYIFLYGGSNEDEMYEDFWAYNAEQEIWYEIRSITGKMTKRLGCTLTTIKNKIYMFGGETEDEKYQNQIYRLTLSEIQFNSKDRIPELKCQLITPTTKNCPAGRTSHSALCYNDRYLIIIGGQGQGFDSKGKPASVLFNDMWCFDTEENSWQLIQIPNQNIFKPRSCFSANIYRNKIFIFGGLISLQNFKSSDELIIFSFSQPQQKSLDSCNICKLHYKPIQVKASEKPIPSISPLKDSFNFGLSSLFKLSRMIKNPFDAACLIIEAYVKMSYGSMFLDLNQNRYILIQGSDVMISKQKFTKIAFNYSFVTESVQQDPLISQTIQDRIADENLQIFGFNLKNGCSRLGKNFAFINQRNNYLDLLLFTEENIFYAEYNIKQRMVGPQQEKSFQIIKNYLDRNCINLNYIENATFSIVISELYKLSPTQNQLIVNDKGHIQIANSFKKVSLQSYCSTLFLKKPLFQLSINNVSVEFRDIQNQYAKFPFQTSFSNDFGAIKLKESQKEGVINYYRRGIRVGKFIKINPPFLRGYVEISPKYELDLLRYRIENTKSIDFQLKNICQQKLQNGNKRKNPTSIRELEELSRKI